MIIISLNIHNLFPTGLSSTKKSREIFFFFLQFLLKCKGGKFAKFSSLADRDLWRQVLHLFFALAQESPESLLRSALQGKGYAKTLHLQSTLIPTQNPTIKQEDEELRRVLYTNDHQVRDYIYFLLNLVPLIAMIRHRNQFESKVAFLKTFLNEFFLVTSTWDAVSISDRDTFLFLFEYLSMLPDNH